MKKLIFLSGNANCGKTTSLKYLIGWFLNLPQPPHSVRVVYCSVHARLNQLWANHRIFSKTPVASPNLQDQENQDMAQKLFHEIMATIKSVLQSTSTTPSNP